MGPRTRWIAPIAIALVTIAVIAPAAGGRKSQPVAHIACEQAATSCSESGSIDLPGKTFGSQSTDVVPTGSTSGTELVVPFTKAELADFDSNWETIVGAFPKLGGIKNAFVRRVLTCAVFAPGASSVHEILATTMSTETARGVDTSQLFLTMCLQTVAATQASGPSPSADAASTGCSQVLVSLPLQIKRTGRTYLAQFSGRPQKAPRRTPLVVSCRAKGLGIQIGMRPRARGRKLHQVIGSHMAIGISNPTSRPVRIRTTFTFG